MVELTVQLPESALAALRKDPGEFASEMRIATAVKWYELGVVKNDDIGPKSGPKLNIGSTISVTWRGPTPVTAAISGPWGWCPGLGLSP